MATGSAESMSDDSKECVNLLYLASTHGSKCDPSGLVYQTESSKQTENSHQHSEMNEEGSEYSSSPDDATLHAVSQSVTVPVGSARPRLNVTPNATAQQQNTGVASVPDSQDYQSENDIGQHSDSISPDAHKESLRRTGPLSPRSRFSSGMDHNAANDNREQTAIQEVQRICPRVNCTEKIVLCLDVSQEMESATFKSRSGDRFEPIKLVKRALGIFVHSKNRIDARHEYALVILKEQAHWVCNFTKNPNKLITILQDLEDCFPSDTMDLTSLFDILHQHITLPQVPDPKVIPPPYIVRAILLYGRSHCIPHWTDKESLKQLMASNYFFLDSFYIHQPPTEDNKCEAIFDTLCELDAKGLFYVYEVSRNPTKLYDSMAQLLAHPLQRPLQRDAMYTIEQSAEVQ